MSEYDYIEAGAQPEPKRRRVRRVLIGVVVVALVGGSAATAYLAYGQWQDHQATQAVAERVAARKAAAEKAEAKRVAAVKECQKQIGDYVEALTDLDSRLGVGMDLDEYSNRAGDAASEQRRVDEDALSEQCGEAMEAADDALALYEAVASEWDDCVWDYYCDTDYDVDFGAWSVAEDLLAEAEDLMNGKGGEDT